MEASSSLEFRVLGPIAPEAFLLDASVQETDPDASAGSGTPDTFSVRRTSSSLVVVKGAVLAPPDKPVRRGSSDLYATAGIGTPDSFSVRRTRSTSSSIVTTFAYPGTGREGFLHGIPSSVVVPRGMFTLRGELMHCFVSYRVSTEGIFLTLHQQESSVGSLCPPALSSLESLRCTSRTPQTARPDGCAGLEGNGLMPRAS